MFPPRVPIALTREEAHSHLRLNLGQRRIVAMPSRRLRPRDDATFRPEADIFKFKSGHPDRQHARVLAVGRSGINQLARTGTPSLGSERIMTNANALSLQWRRSGFAERWGIEGGGRVGRTTPRIGRSRAQTTLVKRIVWRSAAENRLTWVATKAIPIKKLILPAVRRRKSPGGTGSAFLSSTLDQLSQSAKLFIGNLG